MERDLNAGSVARTVFAFGMPLAFGMASHASFNLFDLWIVGSLGEDAVAAVHLGSTINFFPMIVGNGISVGAVALISQRIGRKQHTEAAKTANLASILMLLVSLVLGGACALFARGLIDVQSGTGGSAAVGSEYLEVVSWGTFTMFGLMHVTGVLRAIGNAMWPLVLMLGSNALNIALDFVLIFGWPSFGIEAMGAVGAAWASVLARLVFVVLGYCVLARASSPLRPGRALPRDLRGEFLRILRIGVPQSVQMFVRASLVLTVTRIAGEVGGTAAQAALGVATRLDTVVLFSAVGWAGAATAMVGQASAARLTGRCQRAAWVAAAYAAASGLVCGLVFLLFSDPLYLLFVPEGGAAYLAHGRLYFAVLAFAHPAAAASLVLAGAWNGVGVSVRPMLFDLVGFGLLLQPFLFFWHAQAANLGLLGVWLAVLVVNWLLFAAYAVRLRRSQWAGEWQDVLPLCPESRGSPL